MWIKRILIVVPVVFTIYLLQSMVWVPRASEASDNASRLNRLIFYMGGNPQDMNPWQSTATTDSTISDYLADGLIRYDKMYELEPWLALQVRVDHEITAPLPPNTSAKDFEAAVRAEYGALVSNFSVEESKPERYDLATNAKLGGKEEVKADQKAVEIRRPAKCVIYLATKGIDHKIVSAVDPDFANKIAKRINRPALYDGYSVVALGTPLGAAKAADITEAALGKILKDETFNDITHSPVVDFEMRKGIHWTEGPFFKKSELKDADGRQKEFFGDENGPWWTKGPEVTARDFKLTLDLLKDPDFGSPRRSSFTSIKDTRVFENDPFHLQVVYDDLYSPALSDLTGQPLPYHLWNKDAWTAEAKRRGRGPEDLGIPADKYNPMRALPAREREYSLKPASFGTFVLEPLNGDALPLWKNNQVVRLRRNEFYWERKPEYKFVDYYIFDPALGAETAEIAFTAGAMDNYAAKAFQVARYKMDDRFYVVKRKTTTYEYLGFNCTRPQLADRRVRLALSMAVDVQQILKYVVYDQGIRINGPAYPVLPWYDNDFTFDYTWLTGPKKGQTEKLKYVPYDLEEAKALLGECGFKDSNGKLVDKDGKPFKVQFVNTSGTSPRQDTALLVRQQWAKLGLTVDYQEFEWNVYISQHVMAMDFDICVLGWSGGLDFDSRQLWETASKPPDGLNFVGYSSPEADALMEKLIRTYDPKEQVKLSHEVFDKIASDFPYVFLYSPLATTIIDRHVVWRKQIGTDKYGHAILANRPLDHDDIKNARYSLSFWEKELLRLEEVPTFKAEDRKR